MDAEAFVYLSLGDLVGRVKVYGRIVEPEDAESFLEALKIELDHVRQGLLEQAGD